MYRFCSIRTCGLAEFSDRLLADLQIISDCWLQIPGHRERQFTLGRFDPAYVQFTPVYVTFDVNNQAVAFLNLVPSYRQGLATVDLMRRSHDGVNGLMDYLFAKVFLDLKERGFQRFSLGMAPLAEQGGHGDANWEEKLVHWAIKRVPFLFRADSLRRFKAKYAHEWLPRYAVFESRLDLARMGLALQRVTERPEEKRLTKVPGAA
jgi:phosphatidylglycerol lysyltransferase